MSNDNNEACEVIEDNGSNTIRKPLHISSPNTYPEDWEKASDLLLNTVYVNSFLLLTIGIFILFFPLRGHYTYRWLGYLSFSLVTIILIPISYVKIYNKGTKQFATMFDIDGRKALSLIRKGFILTHVGVLFSYIVFCLPIIDIEIKRRFSTLLLGNSILILAFIFGVVGFLKLSSAIGIPDPSRKGCQLMVVALIVLLVGAFMSFPAIDGAIWTRIVELVILIIGAGLYLYSWIKITTIVPPAY